MATAVALPVFLTGQDTTVLAAPKYYSLGQRFAVLFAALLFEDLVVDLFG